MNSDLDFVLAGYTLEAIQSYHFC